MKNSAIIRSATEEDIDQIIDLCEAHAHYEEAEYNKRGKAARLLSALFSLHPKLYCLVVEHEGQLIGYATYMRQFSTWDATEYIYMDCLYMDAEARGFGIGEKLVRRIHAEGKKLHCDLVQWQTPDFNTRAIKFYHRIGATSKPKERFFLI